jgi:hypothetical protein
MTQVMTKQVMLYHLEVEYSVDEKEERVPIFRLTFGVEDAEGFAKFMHNAMFEFTDLTISTIDKEVNNG